MLGGGTLVKQAGLFGFGFLPAIPVKASDVGFMGFRVQGF